jgi:hypothetical protein
MAHRKDATIVGNHLSERVVHIDEWERVFVRAMYAMERHVDEKW